MQVVLTAQELLERGLMGEVCEMKGLSDWVLATGAIRMDHEVSLSVQEAQRLGLVAVEVE